MPRVHAYNGAHGAQVAAAEGHVVVVVDALRASGTITTLVAHGVQRLFVVAEVEEALAVRRELASEGQPTLLVGERNGLKIAGFDRGNEPVVGNDDLPQTCIFTSSNFAYCCMAAREAPELLVGTVINATACAVLARELAEQQDRDVALLMAGFAQDQTRLNLEDLLSCGCLVDRLGIEPANDAAKGALYAFRYVGVTGLTRQFLATDHGRHLVKLGRQQDILFLAEPDRLGMVAERRAVVDLPGGRAVELTAHSPVGG